MLLFLKWQTFTLYLFLRLYKTLLNKVSVKIINPYVFENSSKNTTIFKMPN